MSNPTLVEGWQSRIDLFFVYSAYTLRYLYLLLLIPFYGQVLGVEGYGLVLAAMSLMNMIWRFTCWGFSTAGMRAIATASPERYAGLFGEHLVARMILSVFALVGGGVAIFLSPVLSANPVAGFAAIALGIVSAFNLGWYFAGSGRPRSAVALEVIGFVISLLLILPLVQKEDDADLVLILLLCSGVIALAIAHWWVRHEISQPPLELKSGYALIRSSSTIFLYNGSSVLLVASSTYLLSIISTQAEVGAFGAAERLVAVGLSVMVPAGQILLPRITAMFSQHDEDAAYSLIRKAMFILFSIGLSGLVCTLLLGHWFVPLIFGSGFEGSVPVLQCLALVFPLSAINLVLSSYVLIPLHKEGMLTKVALLGAALNLLCAIPLGITYGGIGMAVARIVGESIVFLGLSYSCWRIGILPRILRL
ncbi:MATE family efflux transporter [Azotobacter armeniacus]